MPPISSTRFGFDPGRSPPAGRSCAPAVDWTERRPHVAGALGQALLDALLRQNALQRRPDGRALNITRDFLADDRRSVAA